MLTENKRIPDDLAHRLDRIPFALSISDVNLPDHPLIFINKRFSALTGYGDEMVGKNCRFLQAHHDNAGARAEIRNAIETGGRCQCILKNTRKDGSDFYNLLNLDTIRGLNNQIRFALGSQFDLGSDDPMRTDNPRKPHRLESASVLVDQTLRLEVERRNVLARSARQMVEAWCLLENQAE